LSSFGAHSDRVTNEPHRSPYSDFFKSDASKTALDDLYVSVDTEWSEIGDADDDLDAPLVRYSIPSSLSLVVVVGASL
jgi:hypothetical protein